MSQKPLHEAYSERAFKTILETEWQLFEKNPERGEAFCQELDGVIEELLLFPELAPIVSKGYNIRRRIFKRFKYGLLYVIRGDLLLITLFCHLEQNPPIWVDFSS